MLIISFSPSYYSWFVEVHGSRMEQPLAYHEEVLDFLKGQGSLPQMMTPKEVAHMHDVRVVFFWTFLVGILLLCVGGIGVRYYRNQWHRIGVAGLLLGVLCGVVVLTFSWSFDALHLLVFEPGSWQFSWESSLLKAYPPEFFGFTMGLITFVYLLISLIFSARFLYAGILRTFSW